MKIGQISNGFRMKMKDAGVEDAASERILILNITKDADWHSVLIRNSSY